MTRHINQLSDAKTYDQASYSDRDTDVTSISIQDIDFSQKSSTNSNG
jgi:hypothetical protein